MPFPQFDRHKLLIKPLKERKDKVYIESGHVPVNAPVVHPLSDSGKRVMDELVERLACARENGKSRMLTFGAHAIKNGLRRCLSNSSKTVDHPPRHQRRRYHS